MKITRAINNRAMRHAFAIGFCAFVLAALSSVASQSGAERIEVFAAGLILLLVVISIGVLFDIVGVAVTVAQEGPLHAMAANQVFGARHAIRLVRNAHQVASFCNDVIGDVSGTLSGAIGVTLVHNLMQSPTKAGLVWGVTMMTASTAALVVGGKAYGKVLAMEQSTQIMFHIGQCMACVDRVLPFELLTDRRRSRTKRGDRTPRKRNGSAS
ncbi:MAG: hypothetical protein HQ592_04555 [Planctomycetes bacterium]|nr:hypothetical protein [Planctomycetota bacterium]